MIPLSLFVYIVKYGRRSLVAGIDHPGSRRFMKLYSAEQGQQGLDLLPDPEGDVFGGRVFQARKVVDQFVVQLVDYTVDHVFQFFKIHDPAKLRIGCALDIHLEFIGMAVHITALVSFGYVGQEVSGIERELFVNFHDLKFGRKSRPAGREKS